MFSSWFWQDFGVLAFSASQRSKTAQEATKIAPRGPQEGAETAQEAPKTAQDASKTARTECMGKWGGRLATPKNTKEMQHPRGHQDRSKTAQEEPRTTPKPPRRAPRHLKRSRRRPKMPLRRAPSMRKSGGRLATPNYPGEGPNHMQLRVPQSRLKE